MVKRLVNIVLSSLALILLSPLLAVAALGIRLSSSGPILYRARRAGLNGTVFAMYKLRTMHTDQAASSNIITAKNDARLFAFGRWLRRLKIDELPQLFNVLKGEMSLVGPRPEDPQIVERYYYPEHFETLNILPGLASPGSIYNFTHGELMLQEDAPAKHYVERVMAVKLALDLVYVREESLLYDLRIFLRTVWVVTSAALGKRLFPDPPEMKKARHLLSFADWNQKITPHSRGPVVAKSKSGRASGIMERS